MVDPLARPRLLIVTRNFPPLRGGMERLNWHMADELHRWFDVRVIGPTGAGEYATTGIAVRVAALHPLSRFLVEAGFRAIREALAWQPQVVLAGSGLLGPIAWLAARTCGANTAVYVHGLDLTAPHPIYRALWRPTLRRIDTVIANSDSTARLAQAIGIDDHRIAIIHPGVDIASPDPHSRMRFRARCGIGETPILLSVGRLTARKGLREFVADVLPRIVSRAPTTMLLVVGDTPEHALFAQAQSRESILQVAATAGVANNIRFLGKLSDAELADAYAGADLHVFPVLDIPNDPEGFGMVAIEAAAHGLPTVAYATGGVPDAVRDGVSGRLVPPGDQAGFANAALSLLAEPDDRSAIRGFAQQFAWPLFGERIRQVLSTSVQGQRRP